MLFSTYFFPAVNTTEGYKEAVRNASAAAFLVGLIGLLALVFPWLFDRAQETRGEVILNAVVTILGFNIAFITRRRPHMLLHVVIASWSAFELVLRFRGNQLIGSIVMILIFLAAVNGMRAGYHIRSWLP